MQKCLLPFALSTGLLFATPASAQTPITPAPTPPADMVKAVTAHLREAGVTARVIARARKLYRSVTLTGGPTPDWLVDMNATPSGRLCGPGGCLIEIWVPQGERYRRALSLQVLGYKVEPQGRLALSLHGVLCGGTGSEPCHYSFGWTAAHDGQGWFLPVVPVGNARGYLGPLVQALAEAPRTIPALAAQAAAYSAWCRTNGGQANTDAALALLPDLTADGAPEALFDANRATCANADARGAKQQVPCADQAACQSVIFTSLPNGWQPGPVRKPFNYWIKWDAITPRMAIADADCGMCEIEVLDFAR